MPPEGSEEELMEAAEHAGTELLLVPPEGSVVVVGLFFTSPDNVFLLGAGIVSFDFLAAGSWAGRVHTHINSTH